MGLLKKLSGKKLVKKHSLVQNSKKESVLEKENRKIKLLIGNGLKVDNETHITTGIPGLDEVLTQGIPKGHLTLISGSTGSGKTVFSLQLANYHSLNNKKVLFVSFEETKNQLINHMKGFGWDPEELIKKGNLKICQESPYEFARKIEAMLAEEKKELHTDIKPMIIPRGFNPDIVIIDSLSALAAAFDIASQENYRLYIDRLYNFLKENVGNCFLISERTENSKHFSPTGIDEFVMDSVISLDYHPGEQQTVRSLNVVKIRGTGYRSGAVNFDITANGMIVFPKIPIDRNVAKTDFKKRVGSGVAEFDKMLQGGYPEGHMVLMSGNTGSGKSTFAMQFLMEGIKKGEKVIFINLEESSVQIIKTAKEHGWDFEEYQKQGNLKFITPDLIDVYPDRILYQILYEVKKTNSKRMVVDSISSLLSAGINKNQLREFLLQLTGYLKKEGITGMMTYLSEEIFGARGESLLGASSSTELRLSSVVDCIVLLRYLEKENSVHKVINILKLRGSAHDKSIREFEVIKGGIKMGKALNLKQIRQLSKKKPKISIKNLKKRKPKKENGKKTIKKRK